MFACIYFEEDSSLSVVGKKDKDLSVEGEFEPDSKCQMRWKVNQERKIFHGTIIKILDDEKALTKFALDANRDIVKTNTSEKKDVVIEKLLHYEATKNKSNKRKRKITDLLKESKDQEEEFSPKSKKKLITSANEKKEKKETTNEKKEKKETTKKKLEFATRLNDKESNKDILKYCSDLSTQFEEEAGTDQLAIDTCTNLSAVGKHIRNSSNVLCEDFHVQESSDDIPVSKIPVPPPEILALFKAMERPDMKAFVKRFIDHFDSGTSHDHQCYEDVPLTYHNMDNSCDTNYYEQTSQAQYRKTPSCTFPNPESNGQVYPIHVPQKEALPPYQSQHGSYVATNIDCLQNSMSENTDADFFDSMPSQNQEVSMVDMISTGVEYMPTLVKRTSPRKATIVRRTSPRKATQLKSTNACQEKEENQESQENGITEAGQSPGIREAVQSPSGKMVKIVESYPYMVSSDQLFRLTTKAKKDKRPGYAIVLKLMPLVFGIQEMATSRGQGIKPSKTGEIRPALDGNKIKAIKVYADGFCKKNGLSQSNDAELNVAVTEAVAYARKKMKKKL